MRENGMMLGLFAETSLHPGTGSTTGVVDLPVQRERHTGFPIIRASEIKGAMREVAEQKTKNETDATKKKAMADEINIIFGPKDSDHAGALAVTDARILAFPVRSLTNVFIWVTCPMVIDRLKRDAAMLAKNNAKFKDIATLKDISPSNEKAFAIHHEGKIILEELQFDCSKNSDVESHIKAIKKFIPSGNQYKATKDKMDTDLVVISNDDFKHLVKNATQVSARIVLNDKKTSENLWYEETIPPDTLFYTLLMASKPRGGSCIADAKGVLDKVKEVVKDYMQVGGNETIGMGWCALQYLEAK